MNAKWHEQIQRCMAGNAAPEEIAALQQALKEDAELRALYLDYMNLDVALGAAADAASMTGALVPFEEQTADRLPLWAKFSLASLPFGVAAAVVALLLLPTQPYPDAPSLSDSEQVVQLIFQPQFSIPF